MTTHSPLDSHDLLQFKSRLEKQQCELQRMIKKAENEIRALADSGLVDAGELSGGSFKLAVGGNTQILRQLRLVELAFERIHKQPWRV